MDMKKILKDPLTWMIILIIIGLIMIAVLSKGDDGPQPITCKDDETRTSCDGEIVCAPKCKDDMYFNCATRKCDCKSPNKLCEGVTVENKDIGVKAGTKVNITIISLQTRVSGFPLQAFFKTEGEENSYGDAAEMSFECLTEAYTSVSEVRRRMDAAFDI